MRYPIMNRNEKYRVEVPQLNGGINLIDPPEQVEDNQLVDAGNVWWSQGALRTRPGMHKTESGELPVGANGEMAHFVSHNRIGEREQMLGQMRVNASGITFYGYSLSVDSGMTEIGHVYDLPAQNGVVPSCMGVKTESGSETDYYFFLGNGKILKKGENGTLTDAEPYVPTVMVNGKGNAGMTDSEKTSGVSGVLFEGYNRLTGKFRCSFTTDGESDEYWLPASDLDASGEDARVNVSILMADGSTYTTVLVPDIYGRIQAHEDNITAAQFGLDSTQYSDFSMDITMNAKTGVLRFEIIASHNGTDETIRLPFVRSNNLTVTASKTTEGQRESICRMTQCAWFGGDRSGIAGGTRLFVCGNPEKPNLICWSDINRPLYFSENNYAYIGSSDQAVTCFGRQADLLIIFKEHEIYSAQYVAGSDYSYEDVVAGRVIDVAAVGAQFPITPLHPSIGCDCPDSVRLVNNRLVWASSDAHIYMMPTVSQWSERNVRDITARIRRRLEQHSRIELTAAAGGEYEGYYILLVGNTLYLLDAGNSAFQSYSYYASEKKATRLLPWYIWTLEKDGESWAAMVSDGDQVRMLSQSDGIEMTWNLFELAGNTDDGDAVSGWFETKLYDFGRIDRKKAVRELYFGLGDEAGTRVTVSYRTESGTWEDIADVNGEGNAEAYTPGHRRLIRLTPNIRLASVFGMRFTGDGTMAVDRLILYYQMQGVMR